MAEAAESIRFPEMAQSCHMNNLTSVTYNRFTRGACVSSSQRVTNTTMFFGGELHTVAYLCPSFQQSFLLMLMHSNVGSKTHKINNLFFLGEKLVRKSRSVLGYNVSENKYKDNPRVPFQHPSSHLLALQALLFSLGHEIVRITRLQILSDESLTQLK